MVKVGDKVRVHKPRDWRVATYNSVWITAMDPMDGTVQTVKALSAGGKCILVRGAMHSWVSDVRWVELCNDTDENDTEPTRSKCTCDLMAVLIPHGCQCGGE